MASSCGQFFLYCLNKFVNVYGYMLPFMRTRHCVMMSANILRADIRAVSQPTPIVVWHRLEWTTELDSVHWAGS